MRSSDLVRLRHMLDAAREALSFVAGRSRSDLDTDRMLTLSVVKCIEIIGEAANSVSTAFRHKHPQIAWDDIIGMRHRLIHAYYDVNLDILWQTASEELPLLVNAVEQAIWSEQGP